MQTVQVVLTTACQGACAHAGGSTGCVSQTACMTACQGALCRLWQQPHAGRNSFPGCSHVLAQRKCWTVHGLAAAAAAAHERNACVQLARAGLLTEGCAVCAALYLLLGNPMLPDGKGWSVFLPLGVRPHRRLPGRAGRPAAAAGHAHRGPHPGQHPPRVRPPNPKHCIPTAMAHSCALQQAHGSCAQKCRAVVGHGESACYVRSPVRLLVLYSLAAALPNACGVERLPATCLSPVPKPEGALQRSCAASVAPPAACSRPEQEPLTALCWAQIPSRVCLRPGPPRSGWGGWPPSSCAPA